MNNKIAYIIHIIISLILVFPCSVMSWDDDITHVEITEKAIEFDNFLKNYLWDYLNIDYELDNFTLIATDYDQIPDIEFKRFIRLNKHRVSVAKPYYIEKFILTGAEAEDYPNLPFNKFSPIQLFYPNMFIDQFYFLFGSRASHHFHDPLNGSHPGLDNSDSWTKYPVKTVTLDLNNLSGISAANRAIGDNNPVFGNEDVTGAIPSNYFSWKNARDYYQKALTSRYPYDRSHYFALTFLALGHVMHLVEDMAVPSHSRNDFTGDHLFSKAELWKLSNLENFTEKKKTQYIRNLNQDDIDTISRQDLPAYWDNSGSLPQSLAEYSNTSFLSRGTVFTKYGMPSANDCSLNIKSVDFDRKIAYLRSDTTLNEPINHFARISLKSKILTDVINRLLETTLDTSQLDSTCYNDYADLLLPKAVAYASGVLKYFFRGRMNVLVKPDGRLQITNQSDEEMSGRFTAYYNSAGSRRYPIAGGYWDLSIQPGETVLTPYGIGLDTNISTSQPLTLVFEGRLGMEENAVAAKAFKAINAVDILRIYHYNDNTQYLYEEYENYLYTYCWTDWFDVRYSFAHTGTRTAYYLMSFYYNPSEGGPLIFPENGLKSDCTLVPENKNFIGEFNATLPDGVSSLFGKTFAYIDNNCGEPTAAIALDVLPGWQGGHDSPNYYLRSVAGYELPVEAPVPYDETLEPVFISRQEVDAFLSSLHPELVLSDGMIQEDAVYMLLTVPIPDPDTYDLSDERFLGNGPVFGFNPDNLGNDFFIPERWDLEEAHFSNDDHRNINASEYNEIKVFGPDFYCSFEHRWDSGSDHASWIFNPEDPFNPFNTHIEQ